MSGTFLYCSALSHWDSLASKLLKDPKYWDYWWAITPTQLFCGCQESEHRSPPVQYSRVWINLASPSTRKSATSQGRLSPVEW